VCMPINCLNSTFSYSLNDLLNSEKKRNNNSYLDILLSFLQDSKNQCYKSQNKINKLLGVSQPNKFHSNISTIVNLSAANTVSILPTLFFLKLSNQSHRKC